MKTTRADKILDILAGKTDKNGKYSVKLLKVSYSTRLLKSIRTHWQLYLYLTIPVAYIIIFKYIPMYGVQIAFKDFSPRKGITGSPWVGLLNFRMFMQSYQFKRVVLNTLGINLYSLLAAFPFPILLALSLNEVRQRRFKKTVQMFSYIPHFISTVVFVGITYRLLSLNGMINTFISVFGVEPISFMNKPELFKSIYVWSGIWQGVGFSSIIYLAALSAVDTELYDAARIDGVNLLQKIWHVDIPSILPTIIILFILTAAGLMNVGFEKVYLLQNNNPLIMSTSDVISTYVYRIGMVGGSYSFGTAVGLFTAAINMILLVSINKISKKISETSLW